MAKKKTLDQLRAEKEQAEIRLAQEQHKLSRLENRKKYYEKGERAKRTHELCNIGGAVESLAPVFKGLSKQEMYELLEVLFSLPEVRNMLFTRKNVKKQKNGKTAKNEGNAGISRIVGRLKKGIDIFCEP